MDAKDWRGILSQLIKKSSPDTAQLYRMIPFVLVTALWDFIKGQEWVESQAPSLYLRTMEELDNFINLKPNQTAVSADVITDNSTIVAEAKRHVQMYFTEDKAVDFVKEMSALLEKEQELIKAYRDENIKKKVDVSHGQSDPFPGSDGVYMELSQSVRRRPQSPTLDMDVSLEEEMDQPDHVKDNQALLVAELEQLQRDVMEWRCGQLKAHTAHTTHPGLQSLHSRFHKLAESIQRCHQSGPTDDQLMSDLEDQFLDSMLVVDEQPIENFEAEDGPEMSEIVEVVTQTCTTSLLLLGAKAIPSLTIDGARVEVVAERELSSHGQDAALTGTVTTEGSYSEGRQSHQGIRLTWPELCLLPGLKIAMAWPFLRLVYTLQVRAWGHHRTLKVTSMPLTASKVKGQVQMVGARLWYSYSVTNPYQGNLHCPERLPVESVLDLLVSCVSKATKGTWPICEQEKTFLREYLPVDQDNNVSLSSFLHAKHLSGQVSHSYFAWFHGLLNLLTKVLPQPLQDGVFCGFYDQTAAFKKLRAPDVLPHTAIIRPSLSKVEKPKRLDGCTCLVVDIKFSSQASDDQFMSVPLATSSLLKNGWYSTITQMSQEGTTKKLVKDIFKADNSISPVRKALKDYKQDSEDLFKGYNVVVKEIAKLSITSASEEPTQGKKRSHSTAENASPVPPDSPHSMKVSATTRQPIEEMVPSMFQPDSAMRFEAESLPPLPPKLPTEPGQSFTSLPTTLDEAVEPRKARKYTPKSQRVKRGGSRERPNPNVQRALAARVTQGPEPGSNRTRSLDLARPGQPTAFSNNCDSGEARGNQQAVLSDRSKRSVTRFHQRASSSASNCDKLASHQDTDISLPGPDVDMTNPNQHVTYSASQGTKSANEQASNVLSCRSKADITKYDQQSTLSDSHFTESANQQAANFSSSGPEIDVTRFNKQAILSDSHLTNQQAKGSCRASSGGTVPKPQAALPTPHNEAPATPVTPPRPSSLHPDSGDVQQQLQRYLDSGDFQQQLQRYLDSGDFQQQLQLQSHPGPDTPPAGTRALLDNQTGMGSRESDTPVNSASQLGNSLLNKSVNHLTTWVQNPALSDTGNIILALNAVDHPKQTDHAHFNDRMTGMETDNPSDANVPSLAQTESNNVDFNSATYTQTVDSTVVLGSPKITAGKEDTFPQTQTAEMNNDSVKKRDSTSDGLPLPSSSSLSSGFLVEQNAPMDNQPKSPNTAIVNRDVLMCQPSGNDAESCVNDGTDTLVGTCMDAQKSDAITPNLGASPFMDGSLLNELGISEDYLENILDIASPEAEKACYGLLNSSPPGISEEEM